MGRPLGGPRRFRNRAGAEFATILGSKRAIKKTGPAKPDRSSLELSPASLEHTGLALPRRSRASREPALVPVSATASPRAGSSPSQCASSQIIFMGSTGRDQMIWTTCPKRHSWRCIAGRKLFARRRPADPFADRRASPRLEDGLVGSTTPSTPPQGGRHLSGWRCGLTDREQVVDRSPPVADAQAAPFVERQPHKLLGAG